jgi:hypothetical protein
LNTALDVPFTGSEACRSCHAARAASYQRTPMGRSMALVQPEREPPDAAFDHPPSKRRYQVRRRDGKLWHRELLLADGADEVVLSEFPVKYVLGSGHHWANYLAEVDGFLVESPVSWYTLRKTWDMSPGYDGPEQHGFERAIGEGCLFCHAGQAQAVDRSLHRMHFSEAALGCERCHGPGSLHVQHHNNGSRKGADGIDYTIVNPSRLPRELAEAICQQCHLRAGAMVFGRGRKPGDFRPGLPLQDFRQDYQLETPNTAMTVVGHVEQMHLSRCYQASKTLTCVTCHDPHRTPPPSERVQYFKASCLECHTPDKCTVADPVRRRDSPDNNCVACHMPRSPSSIAIPHLAFTHHRIGIHDKPPAAKKSERAPGVLRPFLDLARLGDIDQKRSLGLAFLELANRETDRFFAPDYRDRSLKLLSEAHGAGLRDPVLESSLARLRLDMQLDFLPYAEAALEHRDLEGQQRCNALFMVAERRAADGRHQQAAAALRELTGLRRHPSDWLLLADCENELGNRAGTIAALEKAVAINPRLWKIHAQLARLHDQNGDQKRAAWHLRRAVP